MVLEKVEDIGATVEVDEGEQLSAYERHVEGEIIAVLSSEEYISCIMCSSKVNEVNAVFGKCTKCSAVVKLKKCQKLN